MADKKTKKSTSKASRESVKSLKGKINELENDLLKQSEETNRILDKNIRLLAEFDNYKRRTQEERSNLFLKGFYRIPRSFTGNLLRFLICHD